MRWTQAQLDATVADVFGFHALQCGLPQLHGLRANRMPNRMAAVLPDDRDHVERAVPGVDDDSADAPQAGTGAVQRLVLAQFEDLPFASQSLDLVLLPHALDRSADPHQVLREVDRVLRPEGRVIVVGFNPVSLWGARQFAGRGVGRPWLPGVPQMLGTPRLRDWLKLLSFDLDRGRYGCYAPPVRNPRWLDESAWIERAGDRWWPICGAVYLLSGVKRVHGMRLIGPAWKSTAKAVAGVPAPVRSETLSRAVAPVAADQATGKARSTSAATGRPAGDAPKAAPQPSPARRVAQKALATSSGA